MMSMGGIYIWFGFRPRIYGRQLETPLAHPSIGDPDPWHIWVNHGPLGGGPPSRGRRATPIDFVIPAVRTRKKNRNKQTTRGVAPACQRCVRARERGENG